MDGSYFRKVALSDDPVQRRHALALAVPVGLGLVAALVAALGWDQEIHHWARTWNQGWLGRSWGSAAYHLGLGGWQMALMAALALGAHWRGRGDRAGWYWRGLGAVALSGILVQVVKHLVGRPRPTSGLEWPPGWSLSFDSGLHSFPSGHATTSFALAALLAARWPRGRLVFYGLAGFVSLGRVISGSHYFSDVLGGAILGLVTGWWLAGWGAGEKSDLGEEHKDHKGLAMLAGVWLLAGLLFLGGLNVLPLTDRDEGEYAAVVGAMERTGDYLVPTLNGRHYLEKPGLIYYAMLGGRALLGPTEAADRLPSALSAWLITVGLSLLAWRLTGSLGRAALTGTAVAFTPLMALIGRACLTDMLLTLWCTASVVLFFLASEKPAPQGRRLYLASWAMLGLGFLTKGPVAPAVVLPAALIYALARGRLVMVLKEARLHWGLLICLAINLPWYGAMFYKLGEEFWRAFFLSQNVRRFSEVLLGHGGGFLYYFPVIFLGGFPWALAAAPELCRALSRGQRATRAENPLARFDQLAAIYGLVVLVVFSLAATKQINYIIPAFPFLGWLATGFLTRLAGRATLGRWSQGFFWNGLYGLGGLLTIALAVAPLALPLAWSAILGTIRFDSSEYALPLQAPWLVVWPLLCAALVALMVLGGRHFWRKGQDRRLAPWLAGTAVALCLALMFGLLPSLSGPIQGPVRPLAREVTTRLPSDAQAVTYGLWKPSLFHYLDRDLERFRVDDLEKLGQTLGQDKPVVVVSRVRLADKLAGVAGFQELGRHGGYLVGGNAAAARAWAAAPAEATQP